MGQPDEAIRVIWKMPKALTTVEKGIYAYLMRWLYKELGHVPVTVQMAKFIDHHDTTYWWLYVFPGVGYHVDCNTPNICIISIDDGKISVDSGLAIMDNGINCWVSLAQPTMLDSVKDAIRLSITEYLDTLESL